MAGLIDAHGQQHGVVLLTQLVHGDVGADRGVQHELHPALDQAVDPALDDVLFQLEAGDAVHQQATGAVVTVIDGDDIARAAQTVGRSQTCGASPHDGDALAAFGQRADRFDPAVLEGLISDPCLDRADGHPIPSRLLERASAFAQAILRADAAANLGHGRCQAGGLPRLAQITIRRQGQPVRNIILERAGVLAEGHAAVGAARGLFLTGFRVRLERDLVEITHAISRNLLWQGASLDQETTGIGTTTFLHLHIKAKKSGYVQILSAFRETVANEEGELFGSVTLSAII